MLDQHTLCVCKDKGPYIIQVSQCFPAAPSPGTLTWASVNGKVTINSSSNAKCSITYLDNGDDFLVATLTAGNAVFRDTVKIKAGELAFKEAVSSYLVPVALKIDMESLLTATSRTTNLVWQHSKNGGGYVALAGPNPSLDRSTYNAGDYELIKVKIDAPGGGCCEVEARLNFYKMNVTVANATVCDGEALPFQVTVTPAATPALTATLLGTVAGLVPKALTTVASQGNPLGNTNLAFAAFDAVFKSKVNVMIWYSTQANNCNPTGSYNLWVEGTIGGKAIKSDNTVIASNAAGGCVNGSAGPNQAFTGTPTAITAIDAVGIYGEINTIGTFVRNVTAVANIATNANSQFLAMVTAEENYHVGQFQGTNGALGAQNFIVANVTAGVLNVKFYAATRALAGARAWAAWNASVNAEIAAYNAKMVVPAAYRCRLEKEAKTSAAVNSTYIAKMVCAYAACP